MIPDLAMPTPEEKAALRRWLGAGNPESGLLRNYLARLAHVGESSFVPGDAHATAFNEGKRALFLKLAADAGFDFFALFERPRQG